MRDSFWATASSKAVLFVHTQKAILAKVEDEKPKPPKPAPRPKPAGRECKECGRITTNPCR